VTAVEGCQSALGDRRKKHIEDAAGKGEQTRNDQCEHEDGAKPGLPVVTQKDEEFSEKGHDRRRILAASAVPYGRTAFMS
jgi:hypothetical protein